MIKYAFIKNGKYVLVESEEHEFIENFIDRGQYISKIEPKNNDEYMGALHDSKLFIYNKIHNHHK